MERQKELKEMPCGCIVEKVNKKWYAYQLCNKHKESYYKDPKKYLRLINWAVR